MSKTYRSAMGKAIDMDRLRLIHEETIAVGNMKVNARGDQLGPGGDVARSRNELMSDYYRVNAPLVQQAEPIPEPSEQKIQEEQQIRNVKSTNSLKGSLAKQMLEDQDGDE
jgi:hypothetical protein